MQKTQFILAVLLVGALTLSACGGGASTPAPPPTQASQNPAPTKASGNPAPTEASGQSAPTQASSPNAGESAKDLGTITEGLDALNSYKSSFNMSFDGKDDKDQPQKWSLAFEEDFSKNPLAKRTKFGGAGTGDAGQSGSFESIEVEGKTFVLSGDTCISSESSDAPTAGSTFNPSDIIGDVRGSRDVGVENVNGIPARHYIVDLSSLVTLAGYTNVKAEAWVAEPGNYVVKYILDATGKDQFFGKGTGEGTLHWDYQVTDVNQPVTITAPENCGGAADIPFMPDAKEKSSFGEMSTYTSASALADVVAFYKKEMPANGWTADSAGETTIENMSQMRFAKGGRTVDLTLSYDADTKETSVIITTSGK
jgi:hypothetical protein